jgi:hypothetical protein
MHFAYLFTFTISSDLILQMWPLLARCLAAQVGMEKELEEKRREFGR